MGLREVLKWKRIDVTSQQNKLCGITSAGSSRTIVGRCFQVSSALAVHKNDDSGIEQSTQFCMRDWVRKRFVFALVFNQKLRTSSVLLIDVQPIHDCFANFLNRVGLTDGNGVDVLFVAVVSDLKDVQ